MFAYFEITVRNQYAAREHKIDFEVNLYNTDYFEAWNKCIEKAKEYIDQQDAPYHYIIEKIADVTAR